MPLKSRAAQNRAERAESSDLDQNVAPRAGADLNPPPAQKPMTKAAAPEPERQTVVHPENTPPKAPRKPRTPRPAAPPVKVSADGALDKKAARARMREIEKTVKGMAAEEKAALKKVMTDFAARRSALKNEHADLSRRLSAAAFG